jgi:hypothetical protein
MELQERASMYPKVTSFRTEPGLAGAVIAAARRERCSAGEWTRRAIRRALVGAGIPLPPIRGETGHEPKVPQRAGSDDSR